MLALHALGFRFLGLKLYGFQTSKTHQNTCTGGNQVLLHILLPHPAASQEYLFDHRNGSMLTKWLLEEYIGGPTGIDSPLVDGFFIDDFW